MAPINVAQLVDLGPASLQTRGAVGKDSDEILEQRPFGLSDED